MRIDDFRGIDEPTMGGSPPPYPLPLPPLPSLYT